MVLVCKIVRGEQDGPRKLQEVFVQARDPESKDQSGWWTTVRVCGHSCVEGGRIPLREPSTRYVCGYGPLSVSP